MRTELWKYIYLSQILSGFNLLFQKHKIIRTIFASVLSWDDCFTKVFVFDLNNENTKELPQFFFFLLLKLKQRSYYITQSHSHLSW